MLTITEACKQAHPEASIGIMVINNVQNPAQNDKLVKHKQTLIDNLAARFLSPKELQEHSPIQVYSSYYKRYAKTYHVKQQVESVIFKGKSIPSVAGLVEAMFMAELKNCLLTAGHDFHALKLPLTLDVASGTETYILMNGREQHPKPGDMFIQDSEGIISSIIHGPDLRTRIEPDTRKAVFIVYAPSGITRKEIADHLSDISKYVLAISPNAEVEFHQIFNN